MPKVFVVGETCIDRFVYGKCTRICPEAPVPVFQPLRETKNNGMSGNVVENLRSLGISCQGFHNRKPFPVKTRYVDETSDQMLLRVDEEDEALPFNAFEDLLGEIEKKKPDAVVVSDYNKGFLSEEQIQSIGSLHPYTFLDTKKIIGEWCQTAFSFIKINQNEFERTTRLNPKFSMYPNMIVTLGKGGCMFKGETFQVKQAEVMDVAGAGDTFLAGLVAHFCHYRNIRAAIGFANLCASYVVTKRGVTSVFPQEILDILANFEK